jgi:hypothetical protein
MLTLKVITTDIDGNLDTHLFYGEAISHNERVSNDYQLPTKFLSSGQIVGELTEKISEQQFVFSNIFIYGAGEAYIRRLYVLPHAECYVMEGGKTIDSFSCYFCK